MRKRAKYLDMHLYICTDLNSDFCQLKMKATICRAVQFVREAIFTDNSSPAMLSSGELDP